MVDEEKFTLIPEHALLDTSEAKECPGDTAVPQNMCLDAGIAAAAAAGHTLSRNFLYILSDDFTILPCGCYLHLGYKEMYYNPSSTCLASSSRSVVCRRPSV